MSNNDFEKVKARLPIAEYLISKGLAKKSGGSHYNPSPCCDHDDCFAVDENKGSYKCFRCEAGGSVIDLIMIYEQCDLRRALEIGAKLAGVELAKPAGKQTKKAVVETVTEKLMRAAADYYRTKATPKTSDARKHFCGKRGHTEATFDAMQVGLSDGKLLPNLIKKGFSEGDIINSGLLVGTKDGKELKQPYDYFGVASLIFPISDHNGHVIAMTSKRIVKKPPYPPGKILGKKEWFINHAALGKFAEMFVVEGENDVASLLDAGCQNVIGMAGGGSADQLRLLRTFMAGKTLLLWFDDDDAGEKHTRKIYQSLFSSDVNIKCLTTLPEGANDPDEYIQKYKTAAESAA